MIIPMVIALAGGLYISLYSLQSVIPISILVSRLVIVVMLRAFVQFAIDRSLTCATMDRSRWPKSYAILVNGIIT